MSEDERIAWLEALGIWIPSYARISNPMDNGKVIKGEVVSDRPSFDALLQGRVIEFGTK